MDEIFDLEKSNIISDDDFYYVFRALNNSDHKDIQGAEKIDRIRTDRERWEQVNEKASRFPADGNISLEEVWSHVKKNHSKDTNCISLSSNANVAIDYGKGYHEEYVMVKIPKKGDKSIVLAGQYMLEELSKRIEEVIKNLPQNSEILSLIEKIEDASPTRSMREVTDELFKGAKTGGYIGSNAELKRRTSIRNRFGKKQYLTQEQQKEYDKIISKLTILELHGLTKTILTNSKDNASLLSTIGMAFSSGELIHYGEITNDKMIPISKEMMDVISLVQQAKNNSSFMPEEIKKLEHRIISGVKSKETIVSGLQENNKDMTNIGIEEAYNITGGTIGYEKTKKVIEFTYRLVQSRLKAQDYAKKMQEVFNLGDEFEDILTYIEKSGFTIEPSIINRENGQGIKIAESVNIGVDRNTRNSVISLEEQKKIIEAILKTDVHMLQELNNTEEKELYNSFLKNLLQTDKKKSENTYYAEAIADGLDFSKIYKNAISEEKKKMQDEQRNLLIEKLEVADCKRLYTAFAKAGISDSEIPDYIINLLMDDGYKGFNFAELSRAEELEKIIFTNVNNKMLKSKVVPFRLDELLENKDDLNVVEGTNIKLRDYQQETIDKIDEIYEEKRFAGVVLPTGAGKSFVAITEMLKYKDKNIIYFAPQTEILNQLQRHILKNVLGVQVLTNDEIAELNGKKAPEGKIYPKDINAYISKAFPHLKMYCYQSLSEKDEVTREKQLRSIFANSDADLLIFDEIHRAGAETWEPLIQELIEKNAKAKILGITATPIRDVDKKDMMETLAKYAGGYSKQELINGEYLAKEMYLIDAIQDHLVVEPKIVSFNYSLAESEEYKEVKKMYATEKDVAKRARLKSILDEMGAIIHDTSDLESQIENETDPEKRKELEERFSKLRKETKLENTQGIGEVIKANIIKKDGRYIILLPQNNTNLRYRRICFTRDRKSKRIL